MLDYDFGAAIRVRRHLWRDRQAPPPIRRWCRCSCPASMRTATRSAGVASPLHQAPLGSYLGWNITASGFFKGQICGFAGGYVPFAATRAEREKVRRSEAFGRGALRHAGRLRLRGDARGERARPRPLPAARRRRPSDRQCGKEPHPAVDRRERRGGAAHCGYAVQMTEQSPDLPLRGLKVIDFTRVLAGPLCTMLLGDMGAEVIKIEDPRHGDDTRAWAPFVGGWSTYLPERQPQQEERRRRSEVGGRPGAARRADRARPTCWSRTSARARSSGSDSVPIARGR